MALQKNKREICKDKQILMISRFYKPAFVTIIFLRTYYKRKGRGNARKKLKQLVSLRHCVFLIMTEKRQSMQKKAIVQEYEKYKAQLEKGGTKYKIWLLNQVKVIYWMHKKRNRVELQFCFHTVF